jgi:hypothetical protein
MPMPPPPLLLLRLLLLLLLLLLPFIFLPLLILAVRSSQPFPPLPPAPPIRTLPQKVKSASCITTFDTGVCTAHKCHHDGFADQPPLPSSQRTARHRTLAAVLASATAIAVI